MKSSVLILGTPGREGQPSIMLRFDSQNYLFNCPEGTQRVSVENRTRMVKTHNIFFTRVNWDCIGGLPGLLLTVADAGLSRLKLQGGRNLTHSIAAMRQFLYRQNIDVETLEFPLDALEYQDENIRVTPMILTRQVSSDPVLIDANSKRESLPKRRRSSSPDQDESDSLSIFEKLEYNRKVISGLFPGTSGRKSSVPTVNTTLAVKKRKIEADRPAEATAHNVPEGSLGYGDVPPVIDEVEVQAIKAAARGERRRVKGLPTTTPSEEVLCYIVRGPKDRGKFLPKLAQELGIPRGPLYGKLQRDIPITLDDGRTIQPEQVKSKPRNPRTFAVVDCPDSSYVDSLICNPMWQKFSREASEASEATKMDHGDMKLVIHLLGDQMMGNEAYAKWMESFDDSVQHILLSRDHSSRLPLYAAHTTAQLKLSLLNDRIFRVPDFASADVALSSTMNEKAPPHSVTGINQLVYQLEPTSELDHSVANEFPHPSDVERFIKPNFDGLQDYIRVAVEARQKQNLSTAHVEALLNFLRTNRSENNTWISELIKPYARKTKGGEVDLCQHRADDPYGLEVVTLGTGSAIPSKYRNVSATLLDTSSGSVLLDCGEGTWGQMVRFYGPKHIGQALRQLKCIFISHLHADHHLGTVKVLSRWAETVNTGHISVVAPLRFLTWLKEYAQVQDFGLARVNFVANENMVQGISKDSDSYKLLCTDLQLADITTTPVDHCPKAYGVAFQKASANTKDWKVVYSGDTRPCQALVDIGKDATLLIHEATFDDTKMQEAREKRHSTANEAIDVGKQMNAKAILLNHFSQRYPKLPVLSEHVSNVAISFDLMSVRIRDIQDFSKFYDALRLLYAEPEESEELE
ncbi:hypothetical protein BZG36_04131 [Bifiguratus adelaidae]|uniref:Zinc phosphodiesterase ELAC protein 2 n=1 Tax=Bifiguratus adelaidae TaxID=1938954 RepID=A0A261XW01_9FUNG|nr:hypothetical protein BZG36_04131 [Bifiguratus adelaidae]